MNAHALESGFSRLWNPHLRYHILVICQILLVNAASLKLTVLTLV